MKMFFLITLVTLISACNAHKDPLADTPTKQENNKTHSSPPSTTEVMKKTPTTLKNTSPTDIEVLLAKREGVLKQQNGTRSIHLNNEKFKLLSAEVTQGAKVYNILMKELGTIKGSIIVVTVDSALPLTIKGSKIAKQTYRLYPTNKSSLYEFYKELDKDSKYSTVELEIDYSPINTAPAS